jgi:hypothetical protein
MRVYVAHLQRFPLIALSMSSRVGEGVALSRAIADMICPDWQYPHCGTSFFIQAARIASATLPDTDSMVVIDLPAKEPTGVTHDRIGNPSM